MKKTWTFFAAVAGVTVAFSLIVAPLTVVLLFGSNPAALPGEEAEGPAPGPPDLVAAEVSVYREEAGQVVLMDLETYVAGVVAGEVPATFEEEALKAQAVAARTYALSKMSRGAPEQHPEAPLCDSTHCQVYRSPEELAHLKSAEWMETGWPRIQSAVATTAGQVMYYQGQLVEQPLFHSSSGSRTENSEDVFVSALPYLRSVSSDYEDQAPYRSEETTLSLQDFREKIKRAFGDPGELSPETIKVLENSQGGRVSRIQVGSLELTGRNVREALGLRSAGFTLQVADGSITFTTQGYGHGVGMSQWGANGMAGAGFDYREILAHYYSGVEIR